ncbi:hypothetical protein BMS3Abin03_02182 [bacterium BMS3Abin03]|nr:hypothetical protein BMS3Abin03_02182 [bacterium BMS3Abin03]
MEQLTISGIIKNSISIGLKNLASIVGAVILWVLTIWIPYINVGTTIALLGMVVAISKGGIISPFEIFDKKYRRNMGEFFLLIAFMEIGIMAGLLFFIIPGIVISIAWGQAVYLLIDKNMNPTEAIAMSNKLTYGKKWTIFLGNLILVVVLYIALFIIVLIVSQISGFIAILFSLVGYLAILVIMLAAAAYIYGVLSKELEGNSETQPSE